jgi:hypothetical protein
MIDLLNQRVYCLQIIDPNIDEKLLVPVNILKTNVRVRLRLTVSQSVIISRCLLSGSCNCVLVFAFSVVVFKPCESDNDESMRLRLRGIFLISNAPRFPEELSFMTAALVFLFRPSGKSNI